MKLDLTKIANEPVGWILHGTINSRSKSNSRERIFQVTAKEVIEFIKQDFASYEEICEYLGKLIRTSDPYHKKGSRDPNFSLEKVAKTSSKQAVYSRCRELIYKNYLKGQEKNDSK